MHFILVQEKKIYTFWYAKLESRRRGTGRYTITHIFMIREALFLDLVNGGSPRLRQCKRNDIWMKCTIKVYGKMKRVKEWLWTMVLGWKTMGRQVNYVGLNAYKNSFALFKPGCSVHRSTMLCYEWNIFVIVCHSMQSLPF